MNPQPDWPPKKMAASHLMPVTVLSGQLASLWEEVIAKKAINAGMCAEIACLRRELRRACAVLEAHRISFEISESSLEIQRQTQDLLRGEKD
jgi:hypothetical protein